MSVKVYNSPDIDRFNRYEIFKTTSINRDRNFNERYQTHYLGKDGLSLSKDYSYEYSYNKSFRKKNKSYSNIIKFLVFMLSFLSLLLGFFVTLIALGGLYFIIAISILFFTFILMHSVNLNPLKKNTYKKLGIIK